MGVACVSIRLPKRMKRSWENFKKCVPQYKDLLDLRKSSKNKTPLLLKADCCGDKLEVRRKKDFPLEDLKCKCGKAYLIKWTDE